MAAILGDVAAMSACLLLLLLSCCAAEDEVQQESTDAAADGLPGLVQTAANGTECTVSTDVVSAISERLSKTQKQCTVQTHLLTQLASQLSERESRLETALSSLSGNVKDELAIQDAVIGLTRAELRHVAKELFELDSHVINELRPPPRDCSDLPAESPSGVYLLRPGLWRPVPALCDHDTDGGGWTVFQRRADIQPRQDFNIGWLEYKWGFGQLDGEFWWGLEFLWLTTSLLDRQYELRIDLEDFAGDKRYAVYGRFRIAPELDAYRLTFVNYTGDAGDSLKVHNGQRFSTCDIDQDRDSGSCATVYKGGWWYNSCHHSNLNGEYLVGQHEKKDQGVIWYHWRGSNYSLKTVTMKIRPTKKL